MTRTLWDRFTAPESVVVIGATDKAGSVGKAVFGNLANGDYRGAIYAVNPNRETVLGRPCLRSLQDLPAAADLAVITTPAATVPGLILECADAGIEAALILSAGFGEGGGSGQELSDQALVNARSGGVRLIGPNCLGLISPRVGLNATFAAGMPKAGSVAFLSQSGALGTAILDWSLREQIGFSAFVSVGSMLDLGWAELLDYLGDDPYTRSIILYMESIGDARSFLSAAREIALSKPVIVLKAGRREEGAQAARSHTGAMAGSDEALEAAFERCGILRVRTIAEMFYMAEALAAQPRPRGPRVAVITNAGGPGVLAADSLADEGGALAPLAPETVAALNEILPASWSGGNPIDVLGDAAPERYAAAAKIALSDPNTDSVLAILTPQAMTQPTETAKLLAESDNPENKPLIACWMGGDSVAAGIAVLHAGSIPVFPYPDTAVRIAHSMWRHTQSLRNLYETPQWRERVNWDPDGRMVAANVIRKAVRSKRTLLSEFESKQLLQAYGISVVETRIALTLEDAVEAAASIGYPAVLKIHSEEITHKSDIAGVALNLRDESAVRRAYAAIRDAAGQAGGAAAFLGVTVQPMIEDGGVELLIGSRVDPQLGPVLLFGAGGRLTEILDDYALALPPLNSTLANCMIRKTKIYRALQGARGMQAISDIALERLLIAFSSLALDHPAISEIEINPLLASGGRLIALDARVTLLDRQARSIPPAICPYPEQYVSSWSTRRGIPVTVRPIRPEDEAALARFHAMLSDETVAQRYFSRIGLDQRVSHERLSRMCFIDYDRQMAFVLRRQDPATGMDEILGIARLVRNRRSDEAELAVVIADPYQGQGCGKELVARLLSYARDIKLHRVTADMLPENERMSALCRSLGFRLEKIPRKGIVRAISDCGMPVAKADSPVSAAIYSGG